jgi:spore maturation protein CgeB
VTGRGAVPLDRRIQGLVRAKAASNGFRLMGNPFDDGPVPLDRCHPPVHGDEMFSLLGRAKALVHHEANSEATSLRLFETTGMGAALVTNAVGGLGELFEPGTEILLYHDIDEARKTVAWLNSDPEAASEVGRAGQERALRDHTVEARARQLSAILRRLIAGEVSRGWH